MPFEHYFCAEDIGRIGALLQKGTKIVAFGAQFYDQMMPYKGTITVLLFFSMWPLQSINP